jgi:hypothetical protein
MKTQDLRLRITSISCDLEEIKAKLSRGLGLLDDRGAIEHFGDLHTKLALIEMKLENLKDEISLKGVADD